MDVFSGKEVFLSSFVSQIYHEMSPHSKNEMKGIYTGDVNVDHTCKIRFINEKNYYNKLVAINLGL